jgi:hypothetical protein
MNLWKSEFKGNGIIYFVEEISRKYSIQAVAWLLLTAFSQIDSKRIEKYVVWPEKEKVDSCGQGRHGC